jgi:hypothetical protein
VSFVFVKDVIGTSTILSPDWLLMAWLAWAASSTAVLASFFMSHLALRKCISQCDDGTIYSSRPGGGYSDVIRILNPAGALLFVVGVCLMAGFAYINLAANGTATHVGQKAAERAAAPANSSPAAAMVAPIVSAKGQP